MKLLRLPTIRTRKTPAIPTTKSAQIAPVNQEIAGFTFQEMTLVAFLVGILAAIASPGWQAFMNNHRLNTSTNRIYQAMLVARRHAMRDKTAWQASFQETTNLVGQPVIKWAVHKAAIAPGDLPTSSWDYLEPGIEIDDNQKNDQGKYETTLLIVDPDTNNVINERINPMYRALFNYKGCPVYRPNNQCHQTSIRAKGGIAIKHENQVQPKKCVIVSTLLGAMRTGKDQEQANRQGRYCY